MKRTGLFLVAAFSLAGFAVASAEVLPLPENLIAFDSAAGEQLLFHSESTTAYFPLSSQFVTQATQSYCGVASLVMVLNALRIPAPQSQVLKPFSAFDQANFFSAQTEAVRPRALIEQRGMTLDQLGGLATAWGAKAEVHHAADSSLGEFRVIASKRLATADQYVVVNFLRSAIGQQKFGHISPLAAYDADTDRFLVLDVARYKYAPFWVSATELFSAMNTTDSDAENRTRGYVVLGR
jgi:hypothetical protein